MIEVMVYQRIAQLMDQRLYCLGQDNMEKYNKYSDHEEEIEKICKEHMPSGSGFDCGTKFNFDKSNTERLVFDIGYHHMDEHGFYDGWSELTVKIYPSFYNHFYMKITGSRRKDRSINKDFFWDTMYYHLTQKIEK